MHYRSGEKIIAKIRRSPTPFIFTILFIVLVSLPFYFFAYFIGKVVGASFIVISFLTVSAGVGFFIFYTGLLYFMDHLIITSERVVFTDWKSIFTKEEFEAELIDIQDIYTKEHGIISKLKIFDFGTLKIETASSKTTILFEKAPDPEGIKHFILSYIKKNPVL